MSQCLIYWTKPGRKHIEILDSSLSWECFYTKEQEAGCVRWKRIENNGNESVEHDMWQNPKGQKK